MSEGSHSTPVILLYAASRGRLLYLRLPVFSTVVHLSFVCMFTCFVIVGLSVVRPAKQRPPIRLLRTIILPIRYRWLISSTIFTLKTTFISHQPQTAPTPRHSHRTGRSHARIWHLTPI